MKRRLLALGLVLLAPCFAEYLSSYDVHTGDPLPLLGGLLILGPLYGCPALLIRETAQRRGLGWPGILLLALAFGILQAGVIDQGIFNDSYRDISYWDEMLLPTYLEPLGFAPAMALSFLIGHVVWSFGAPIALMEGVAGPEAERTWLRWPGLVVTTLLYLAAAWLILSESMRTEADDATAAEIAGSLAVVAILIVTALKLKPRKEKTDRQIPRPLILGAVALAATFGFLMLSEDWLGFWTGSAILIVAAVVLVHLSRSTRWERRHPVAVAGAAVMAMALLAFLVTPLGEVSAVRKYGHNVVLLLGSAALIVVALRHSGAGTQPATSPRGHAG